MNTIFEDLKKYFANTPQDIILRDWRATEKDDEIGPTVNEFLCYTDFFFNINYSGEIRPKQKVTINQNEPEEYFGFFITIQ